jgi:chromosome segregation ATPase
MGLGSTAKKLQQVADVAEKLFERMNQLREQVQNTQETVEDTNERVATLEDELAEQRAVLEAVADQQGVDVSALDSEGARETGEADAGAD